MRTNSVRERVRAGQPTIGAFMGLGSPNVAELLGHAGFDWLVIETEHNGLDSAEIQQMLMAISATEAIPLVRLPSGNPVFIQRALDMGAMGIVVPMVRTAAEAEAIVRATRYPPEGARGFGPMRAAHYSFDNEDYLKRANDNILVVLILETREALENLEAIAAVPGIDVLFLGSFDLCLALGLNPLRQPHPEINAAIERMLAVGRESGVAMGSGAIAPDQIAPLQARGFTFVGYGPEYVVFALAARAAVAAFQR